VPQSVRTPVRGDSIAPRSERHVLLVEDEMVIRSTLREFLQGEGFCVGEAGGVNEALLLARNRNFAVAVCDVQLPDGDGIKLTRRLLQLNPDILVLVITAYATVDNAVEAFQSGAYDYLVKPVLFEDLRHKLERLFRYRELFLENQSLRRELSRLDRFDELVGSSEAFREVQTAIRKIASTSSHVLLEGESGVGKGMFARLIHASGPRSAEKFLTVHGSTVPVEELESKLFGRAAPETQPGLLVQVGQGTVFIDEAAALPLATQAQLLRAMELQQVIPRGGTEPTKIAARIIASTTRDLSREVAEGRFLPDLFYRLNGVRIRIPSLRERLDDIPELVEFFLAKQTASLGKRVTSVSRETMRLLMSARWKGNVRELDNTIERAVIMCDGAVIEPKDLPPDLLGVGQIIPENDDLRSALRHYEKLHISRVLRQCPDKREAAKRLRLGLSSLYRKIEDLGIEL
jgi:DNA-binding NtrC family response regulator